ncbi:MAG: methionyl-tRNA formyltransferase [Candidatus Moranbacteria bacterium CG_4_10_14_3_um_filter_44_15]|nr:MAG: methionyl-tRNA formyltransferase [Candidatus Moranbacteria bacterium CG06_land_8_20_14_3_00_43_56]PIV83532.1 MAG: methionyl-tRNA formyltransferase [Candidatus Moranbacteria bacterium CG17_big_fil_post_rev_8_21_14_2_50_44_12]PIX91108.1 MAG: methionyl-tRNA formyltransferase [Candidatus Moranbacteria bacterium CG_4_10_14_3_um_filter_44_15]PJA85566.1 MAG: methionyl-tRNA formyltransferase [Candidatus Moranbacteria bacterium CG_4_9_14_3_um_filter_44_28]
MKKRNKKIIFFGTSDFAAVILKALIKNGFNVVAVFTQPDKKIGRKQETIFSPVKKLAFGKKIKIFQPENLRNESLIGKIREIGVDLIIVAAYGKILPKEILKIPRYGSVNVHASLLPKYRGASPVQGAILGGEKETGVTLMLMNEKMDKGDVLMQEKIQVGESETAKNLLGKLGRLGAKMLVGFVPDWISGEIKPQPPDETKATYCKPIGRKDGRINWSEPAEEIYRKHRAYQPWPGIFTSYDKNGRLFRLKLISISAEQKASAGKKPGEVVKYGQDVGVQTGKGLILLKKIQLEGKKPMSINDFIRGNQNFIGINLGG